MEPWNLRDLAAALNGDLLHCHTPLERQCVGAIASREIRERAAELYRARKLTPGEQAIAESFGWRHATTKES